MRQRVASAADQLVLEISVQGAEGWEDLYYELPELVGRIRQAYRDAILDEADRHGR